MDKRQSVEVTDLAPGAELDQEQLRAVVGAQASLRQRASTCCVCGGTDCD